MAVTITGSKYGDSILTAVGVTDVTIGVGTFNPSDFARTTPRLLALFSAAGAFKGISYARVCLNSTIIALERRFFDPKDGSEFTQAIGDIVLVSRWYCSKFTQCDCHRSS
jgi:hypothetical protein